MKKIDGEWRGAQNGEWHLRNLKNASGKPLFDAPVTATSKLCKGCNTEKPAEEFFRRGGCWNKDGLSWGCKECNEKRNAGYERARQRLTGEIERDPVEIELRDPHEDEETLSKYLCIGGLYPVGGVPGVLGVSVTGEAEIADLAEGLPGWQRDKVTFIRLTSIPEKASSWLLPGDIVCKHSGLSESFLDVLRKRQTVKHLTPWTSHSKHWFWIMDDEDRDFAAYQKQAEAVRDEAIESHEWKVTVKGRLLAICDPQGRLAYIVSHALSQEVLVSLIYRVEVGFYSRMSNRAKVMASLQAKSIHRYMFSRDEFTGYHYSRMVTRMPWLRWAIDRTTTPLRYHKMDKVQVTCMKGEIARRFFSTLRKYYLLSPGGMGRVVQRLADKDFRGKLIVEYDELHELLMYAFHDEWMMLDMPFKFSRVRNRRVEAVNRERRRRLLLEQEGACSEG